MEDTFTTTLDGAEAFERARAEDDYDPRDDDRWDARHEGPRPQRSFGRWAVSARGPRIGPTPF